MTYYALALLFAVSGVMTRAEEAMEQEKYDHAVELYQFALDEDPDSHAALLGMARAYSFSDRYDKAIETYNRALELHPGSASALAGRARIYMWQDLYDKAWRDLQRAESEDPTSSMLWQAIGDYHRYRGNDERAYEAYSRWVELSPLSGRAHLNRARVGKHVVGPGRVRDDLDKAEELGASQPEIESVRADLQQERREGWQADLKYTFTALDEGFDNWHTVSPKIKRSFDPASISLAYILTHRFGEYDHAAVATTYFDLWPSAYGNVRLQGSPPGETALATFDASARLAQSLGKSWVLTGGYRLLVFSEPIHLAQLEIAKYISDWYLFGGLGASFSKSDDPGTDRTVGTLSYSLGVRYYYGSADDYVEFDGGVGETRLDGSTFIGGKTFEYSAGATIQKFFTSRYGASLSLGYERFRDTADRYSISTSGTLRW